MLFVLISSKIYCSVYVYWLPDKCKCCKRKLLIEVYVKTNYKYLPILSLRLFILLCYFCHVLEILTVFKKQVFFNYMKETFSLELYTK